MGKLGNSNTTLIRHDFKRALYRAMLSEFTVEEIKEFFDLVPLIIEGRRISGSELFELMWKEKAKIPSCYDVATDNEIESFVLSKGRTFDTVMRKILWLNNNSTVMPGRVLLGWFYPKLELLFTSLDSRDMVFSLITIHNENWIPDLIHRRIKKREENGWIESTMVFISDKRYREYLDWDLELIGGPQILSVPGAIGMPPFEKFGMVADTRPVERVLSNSSDIHHWDDDNFAINGVNYGQRVPFAEFWRRKGLDLESFNPPEMKVAEITRDYVCPIRKRIVLHAGCAYGAPLYIHTVTHRKLKETKKGLLGNLVEDLVREDELQKDELEGKHTALLASLMKPAEFRYFPLDESLTLNGSHFTKGIPAKIMKYLLDSHLQEGKREFEYRDLKRLFEITLGQKNSNFEVRFYRLVEKLENEPIGLRIEKTGRGRFRLAVTAKLQFESK